MILMCMLVIGVFIIFFVLLIEGSSRLKTSVLVHMIVPALVLILNFYVVTLEEKDEVLFFSKNQGRFILSLAFAMSCLALFITLTLKIGEQSEDGDLG